MDPLFTYYESDVPEIELPKEFDFPFYYTPHKLAEIAADELQEYLRNQEDWHHDFGMDASSPAHAVGKMFGVLVVMNASGELGYLKAFSGKMANTNVLPPFVPPVFDNLVEGDFYRKGEEELNQINARVAELENDSILDDLIREEADLQNLALQQISEMKRTVREAKKLRDIKRQEGSKSLSPEEFRDLEERLKNESRHLNGELVRLKTRFEEELHSIRKKIIIRQEEVNALKQERKAKSTDLQRRIFEKFQFLNAKGEHRSVFDIFHETKNENPPAGAGDCAAPKLLHYAYQNNLQPICMAEFWWGRPPKNEVRKHLNFYTSCRGKCEPILGHMLKGLQVAANPMLKPSESEVEIEVIYEDEALVVINKPHELLSVPGKNENDSVLTRMRERYPDATGPLIVHRLDMSTSGLLLIPKTRKAHKRLQAQFRQRTIHKTYVALLDGKVEGENGVIDLPLRVDLNDRPRQMVCYEHGRQAVTEWRVLESRENQTLIQFHPITGRTHQLRVHAAHADGLGASIHGDDLYGNAGDRLYLHAAEITLTHPITKEEVTFKAPVTW